MTDTAATLAALLDREAIRDCIARLARGEDRRDSGLISAAFWPDASTDYGVFQGSFADYLAWVVPGADAITDTQHVVGQTFIVLDGETAKAESQVVSYHRIDTGANEQAGSSATPASAGATSTCSRNAAANGGSRRGPCSTTGIRTGGRRSTGRKA